MSPKIDIDSNSGFCFGVTTAITKAEEELAGGTPLYCLGDIVHNSAEMERLARKGLRTIAYDDFSTLREARVLLRAHGEPPSTYHLAAEHNITVIDATCPVVLRLQKRIKQAYDNALKECRKLQIVIYGQPGHAEVNGLVGQTDGTAIVIEGPEQLDKVDMNLDIALYSQTTKSVEGLRHIVDIIRQQKAPHTSFTSYDTICRQVANRVDRLKDFAVGHDVVLFVAGEKSSNGRVLFSHCLSVNPRSYILAAPEDLDAEWIKGAESVGICGATSTPRWLMEKVAKIVQSLCNHL